MKNEVDEVYAYFLKNHIEISKEIFEIYEKDRKKENAATRQLFRYSVNSLDRDDGISNLAKNPILTPEESLEKTEMDVLIHTALRSLSAIQARRIYAHFFLELKQSEIARIEGVDRSQVNRSIKSGLINLKKVLDDSI